LFKTLKNDNDVIDSLPKLLLSEAVRKIRDSFPFAAGSPMFIGSLNFPSWIDLTNSD